MAEEMDQAEVFRGFLRTHPPQGAVGCALEAAEALFPETAGAGYLFSRYAGARFSDGLYRLHLASAVARWDAIVGEAFPARAGRIRCFGADWLGRQFALDANRRSGAERLVLLLDIGAGQVLEIPTDFLRFHTDELVNEPEAALALGFFQEWSNHSKSRLAESQCVGYRVPLFLGGSDDVGNLEVTDAEVYWGVLGQLWKKVRDLAPGTPVGRVHRSE